MIAVTREYFAEVWDAWNEFWFAPTSPTTLSAIRVLAGAMLLYTHFIWTWGLGDFFGPNGWLPESVMQTVHQVDDPDGPGPATGSQRAIWSHFDYVQKPFWMGLIHGIALLVFFFLFIGLFSRVVAVLAFLFAVSYANRITPGAYFGLDKINTMLAMYLMVGPCGARYSIDRLWRMRKGVTDVPTSSTANLAIRLIQVHMCIIYLFSGLAKDRGFHWVVGEATWLSFDMAEYRSLDMGLLVRHPLFLNFVTHVTVFWELTYCALVWPKLTRPWVLLMAVLVHGGIIIALGMPTFGFAMLIGNLAFVSPKTVRKFFDPLARRLSLLVVGKAARAAGE